MAQDALHRRVVAEEAVVGADSCSHRRQDAGLPIIALRCVIMYLVVHTAVLQDHSSPMQVQRALICLWVRVRGMKHEAERRISINPR